MRGAGVDIADTQTKVTTNIGDSEIAGTLDVAITDEHGSPKVWDIKSASDYSFANKFAKGYRAIEADDVFGYINARSFICRRISGSLRWVDCG
jgi:hypothetical protein